ncbi:BON domain-containing protein [Leptolyngbya sp. FACHB-261]|uniref:BON domain-containing protein n=1 Tax=Leptolyngbya sp. FACHB-261 TaxID=2692806 RepID=UPI001687E378|nr:BON domain-containing protein [Leptolyngbya sp. FACHB-261]MBD2101413.1 BON domain-containing protein [Leptolyngbya sp. FACHB-261]
MGFLQRLFGIGRGNQGNQQQTTTAQQPAATAAPRAAQADAGQDIPPERMGLNGEYDQSGLAKRVAAAFDDDSQITDVDTLYVAQTGTTVVLKGSVPEQAILSRMAEVARSVNGATAVDTSQVTVG